MSVRLTSAAVAAVRTVLLPALVAALAPLVIPAPSAAAADPATWSLEAALLAGHHDNFFFRGPGAAAPSSDLVSMAFVAEREQDLGRSDLTLLFEAQGVFVLDIDRADFQLALAGVEYKLGALKLHAAYEMQLNSLFAEEGEAVFFDGQSVDLWARYSLSRRLWVRGRVQLERWDFDPAENERDSDVTKLELTVRWALAERLALRGSLLYEDREADGARNNRTGEGWALAVEARPAERVDLFIRFRRRDREYEDALPGDNNFQRDDTIQDVDLNLRWLVTRRWGVQFRDSYREGESTRPDRNFDGNRAEAGVFVQF